MHIANASTADMDVRVEFPMDGCALVTLHRPRVKNALSVAVRRRLVELFEVELRSQARVIVLMGAGGDFCAGLDLREVGSADVRETLLAPQNDVVRALRTFEGPVIGAVDGACVAGGFELALACDVLLAGSKARFADTHARLGILPGWGLSQALQRAIGPGRARQISLTGNFIDASRALAWGLVNEVFEPDALVPAALALAADMLATEPATLIAYKRLMDDGAMLTYGDALALEQARASDWIEHISTDGLAQRRDAVVKRGRAQAGQINGRNTTHAR